jgi:hypothetical protein
MDVYLGSLATTAASLTDVGEAAGAQRLVLTRCTATVAVVVARSGA